MSERYTRLFSLPENQYAAGAPVLIRAGALLKDGATGNVLVQLKLRNIGKERVKAVKVKVFPYDTIGKPLGDCVEYQYLDLSADRDADFGQKEPVVLPDNTTRSFAVEVVEVALSDNRAWTASGASWEPMSLPIRLSDTIRDAELLKQYHIRYGSECEYAVSEPHDLWYCACGALNRREEAACHACGRELSALRAVDWEALSTERDKRLKREQNAREEAARRAEQEAAERKAAAEVRTKKVKKLAVVIAPIAAAAIILAVLITQVFIPHGRYRAAMALASAGRYDDAVTALEAMEGFGGSEKKILEVTYMKAEAELENGRYREAQEIFSGLGSFSDAPERVDEISAIAYGYGADAFAEADYETAAEWFALAGTYKDAPHFSIYCDLKVTDFEDGEIHDLASLYQRIIAMDDGEMKEELLSIRQFQTVEMLEGQWYVYNGNRKNEGVSRTFADGMSIIISADEFEYGRPLLYFDGGYYEDYTSPEDYMQLKAIFKDSFREIHVSDPYVYTDSNGKRQEINMNWDWTYKR